MVKCFRKSHFTLLELLVVILIISLGAALTGIKVKEIYHEQRFLSEAQQVLSQLATAQDLMLMMDTDVQVKFTPDPKSKNLQVWLEVEKPLEALWARIIERKVTLQAIHSYDFENHHGRELTLNFFFGKMSQGTLTLSEGEKYSSRKNDKRSCQIELAGYPRPLQILFEEDQETRKLSRPPLERSKSLYPIEVYEKLYEDPNQEKETI